VNLWEQAEVAYINGQIPGKIIRAIKVNIKFILSEKGEKYEEC